MDIPITDPMTDPIPDPIPDPSAVLPEAPAPRKESKWTRAWQAAANGLFRAWDEYGYLLIAAVVPMVVMYLIYLTRGIYPFGDECVMVLDLNGQYVSFYECLYNILHGKADLLYTFSRTLGGEFLGIFDYYVASPFALLLCLFPQRRMMEALLALFLLKVALCGCNMGFYLHKHAAEKPNKLAVIAFSTLYALSSYAIIQQHNSMWMDAVLWLPLLVYGIEELIKRGHFRLFVFTLAITVYSNFYIGYMVCIFTAAYFFYYYFAHNQDNENNPTGESAHFVKSASRILVWSLLALGIAAVAILSAKYSLGFGKSEFTHPKWDVEQKFDFIDFLYKFLPASFDSVRPVGLPCLYCGMLTVMLVPAFFLCRKFSDREKVAAASLIIFFVLSMTVSTLDLIWHGFQKPNWLNGRYSFMLCFFLIVLAFRAFDQIRYASRKALLGSTVCIAAFILVCQKLASGKLIFTKTAESNHNFAFHTYATIWLALACVFLYFILIALTAKVSDRKREVVSLILVLAVCTEVYLNGLSEMNSLDLDVTYSNYSKYNVFIDTFRPITDTLHKYDKGFYRTEKTYARKLNDNIALGLRGFSTSTSTLNRKTIDFMRNMGYASQAHWTKYAGGGGTPVNDSLLGIKYLISDDDWSYYYGEPVLTPKDYHYKEGFEPGGRHGVPKESNIYLNPYAQSIAFAADEAWMDFSCDDYDNPFDRINAMATALLGEDETVELFRPTERLGEPESKGLEKRTNFGKIGGKRLIGYFAMDEAKAKEATLTYKYHVPTETDLYFYLPASKYQREVKLKVNGSGKGSYGGKETQRIIPLGKFSSSEMSLTLQLDNSSNNLYVLDQPSYVYRIDMPTFKDVMGRLQRLSFQIDESSTDSHLTGTIETDSERPLVFTSIPYDKGWNIRVDGKKVEPLMAANALIAFRPETTGAHTLEMRYMPRIVAAGIACTCICAAVFVLLLILAPFRRRVPFLKRVYAIDAPDLPLLEEGDAGFLPGDIGEPPKDIPPSDPTAPSPPVKRPPKKANARTQGARKPPQGGKRKGGKRRR